MHVLTEGGGGWKMSFVMRSWHFYDCEQVLKTSQASYHHYPPRLSGRPQTWSISSPSCQKGLEYGAAHLQTKKKRKSLIVFTVHASQDIFKIYYTWMLFLAFNHLSSLSCNLYWSDYWVNIAITSEVYKWNVSLCHWSLINPFTQLDWQCARWSEQSHPCERCRFAPPDIYSALSVFFLNALHILNSLLFGEMLRSHVFPGVWDKLQLWQVLNNNQKQL